MPAPPPPADAAAPVLAALTRLRQRALAAEGGVLDVLAVLGEPRAQRVLDDWLDLAAAGLRSLAETAAAEEGRLGALGAASPDGPRPRARPLSAEQPR